MLCAGAGAASCSVWLNARSDPASSRTAGKLLLFFLWGGFDFACMGVFPLPVKRSGRPGMGAVGGLEEGQLIPLGSSDCTTESQRSVSRD